MRMFVGLSPPPDLVADLDAFLEPRRDHGHWRWSDPESFHLTLAFCADVPEHALDAFGERLTRAAARHTGFSLTLRGGGTFPDPDRATLLYAVPTGEPAALTTLEGLARASRAAAAVSGVAVAGGRFTPHVTLARSTRGLLATPWLRVLDTYQSPPWPVREVHLVQSHLGEGRARRPRYEIISTHPLD